jgi:hypothetical protein
MIVGQGKRRAAKTNIPLMTVGPLDDKTGQRLSPGSSSKKRP